MNRKNHEAVELTRNLNSLLASIAGGVSGSLAGISPEGLQSLQDQFGCVQEEFGERLAEVFAAFEGKIDECS